MNISYRIMGVPKRMENIRLLQQQLGIDDSHIFLDTEYRKNPMWTWKQTALLDVDKDATHICIVQDDAVLCNDFKDFCEYLIALHSDYIFMLKNQKDWSRRLPYGCIFKPGYVVSAVVSMITKKYMNDIIDCWNDWKQETMDDRMICYWAHNNNVKVCTTYPTCCNMLQKK